MSNITFNDFKKLDIRVGTITNAEVPEWSHWVVKLTVDLGMEIGERTIFAGVLGFYEPKDLKGKQFPFIVNLEPKKIGPKGDFSEGMLLAAVMPLEKPVKVMDSETDEKPVLLELSENVPNGTKVS
jgi:methionine--tRNA ligase beta chain